MARVDGNSGSGTQIVCIEGPSEFEIVNGRLEIEIDAGARREGRVVVRLPETGARREGRVVVRLSPTETEALARLLRNRK